MDLLTMEDQLILDLLDMMDFFSEEAWTTSLSEMFELLLLLFVVLFLKIRLSLLKVLLDDTTVHHSSKSLVDSCGATMMEEQEASPFSTLVFILS